MQFFLQQSVLLAKLSVTLLLMSFISACSQPSLTPLQKNDVIIAFGDSLTAGVGVPAQQSYPALLAKRIGHRVINAGVSGETTLAGLQRLPKVLAKHQPKLVILMQGGNDLLQKKTSSQIQANLTTMIQLIQDSGAEVVLVGMPEKKLFGGSLDLYSVLGEKFKIPVEEDIIPNLMMRASMKSDFVHFNEAGYQALAKAVEELLRDHKAIP